MSIEPLKKVIQAAIPEIMELKFGCRVSFNHQPNVGHIVTKVIDNPEWEKDYKVLELLNMSGQFANGLFIVDGRPIRLSDVLVAIGKNKHYNKIIDDVDGYIYELRGTVSSGSEMGIKDIFSVTKVPWNYSDDNLDHQSKECIELLTKLLVK